MVMKINLTSILKTIMVTIHTNTLSRNAKVVQYTHCYQRVLVLHIEQARLCIDPKCMFHGYVVANDYKFVGNIWVPPTDKPFLNCC